MSCTNNPARSFLQLANCQRSHPVSPTISSSSDQEKASSPPAAEPPSSPLTNLDTPVPSPPPTRIEWVGDRYAFRRNPPGQAGYYIPVEWVQHPDTRRHHWCYETAGHDFYFLTDDEAAGNFSPLDIPIARYRVSSPPEANTPIPMATVTEIKAETRQSS